MKLANFSKSRCVNLIFSNILETKVQETFQSLLDDKIRTLIILYRFSAVTGM